MPDYNAPLDDMRFLLRQVFGFNSPAMDEATMDAVLGEMAKFSSEVLAPLNATGDKHGAKREGSIVTTAPGFKDAYTQYRNDGWNGLSSDPAYGGQGLPHAIGFAVQEMVQGSNLSFGLCPLLNNGAIEAIHAHGTDEQKKFYLPKLISGEWTGTMNLTEPQAGTDLGLLRCKAERQDDGSYKISGQKIFITYGEHDYTDNIIHLVLARLPDAPADSKGISLFIVPKILKDGTRNNVQCSGLEEKLGIHASPTCTMQFEEAKGYLLGQENGGLKCMFTMMNHARLSVGLQGVGVAEAAYQAARHYASEREQGRDSDNVPVTIDQHGDIQRILSSMRAQTEAGRALVYEAAMALDMVVKGDKAAQVKVALLTPVVKAWCTDMAVRVASEGIQVHGGMGFIEETGVAQFLRDARILPIYEGTNGIQALDLVKKVTKDGAASARQYIREAEANIPAEYKPHFNRALAGLERATESLLNAAKQGNQKQLSLSAVPYLQAFGTVAAGALIARSAGVAGTGTPFGDDKAEMAAAYIRFILPQASAHLEAVLS